MPRYEVTSPSGERFEITAPEGASQADVLSYAKQQFARGERVAAQQKADRELYDPTKGMSGLEKVRANLGAGMSDVFHGIQQRYNEAVGDDAKAAELRQETLEKRGRDKQLKEATTGGGALQFAGAAVPTLATALIPGGQGVATGALAGAAGGALSGLVQPTAEGESVGANTALGGVTGGVIGGALPLAMRGLRKVGQVMGVGAERGAGERIAQDTIRNARQTVTSESEAAREAAARASLDEIANRGAGPNLSQSLGNASTADVARLQAGAAARRGIPLTAAASRGDAGLARLEQASRTRVPQAWREFDQGQGRALTQALRDATTEGAEIQARQGAATAGYEAGERAAAQAIDPAAFATEVQQLRAALEEQLAAPGSFDKSVRAAVQEAIDGIDRAGATIRPEHLTALRRNLSGRVNPASQNPLQAAPRGTGPIIAMKGNVDTLLDSLSGNQWAPVNQAYSEALRGVEAARAAETVRRTFLDPETGTSLKTAMDAAGEIPYITESGLLQAINKTRDEAGRSTLSPNARAGIDDMLSAVRAQNLIQQLNRTATSGGGSATTTTASAVQQEAANLLRDRARDVPIAGHVVRGLQGIGGLANARTDATMARALQDPDMLAQVLRAAGYGEAEQAALIAQIMRGAGNVATQGTARGATPAALTDLLRDKQPEQGR